MKKSHEVIRFNLFDRKSTRRKAYFLTTERLELTNDVFQIYITLQFI